MIPFRGSYFGQCGEVNDLDGDVNIITGWYLTKITSPKGNQILFNYSEGNTVVGSNSTSMYDALLFNGLQDEGLILNILGIILIFLAIIIPVALSCSHRNRK